ncbi:hypothetical protein [Nocardia sp. NPDC058480]|uniref:hypothetical protein n=1 Tax=Nocardia sp. NPDC058480 TaxID=3346522 RepID=UPI00365FD21C
MPMLDFDPDRVRALGTSFDTVGHVLAALDVGGNTEQLQTDLAGALTAPMCQTVSDMARDALLAVRTNFVSVSEITLLAVSEFTGKDEAIASDIARAGQGVR